MRLNPQAQKLRKYVREWAVAEYESGWYVEMPDYSKPAESCAFIEIAGPFKTKALAQASLREMQAFARKVR